MHYRTCCSAAYLLVYVATAAWAQPAPPSGGTPPGGTPPGGPPPGGSSAASVTYYATYKLDGGTATATGQTYQASATDTSAVWVDNGGSLVLNDSVLQSSGNTSSDDSSSFYGLNAGLLVTAAGSATVSGGSGESVSIAYVSPTSLMVLAPAGLGAGETTVAVTTSGRSSSVPARSAGRMPGLFGASGYVTAAPIRAGDTFQLLATGLGAAPAEMPAAAIGGKAATVSSSLLVAPGLYKIGVTVPGDLPAGTYPVVITIGGVSSPATAKVKVEARQ